MRQNLQNEHTKSHVINPALAKQNVSTAGPSNRGQANGPGSNHRAPDASSMVRSIGFFYFKLHTCPIYTKYIIIFISLKMVNTPNNMQNERAHGSGFGNNRRVADAASTMVKPMMGFVYQIN